MSPKNLSTGLIIPTDSGPWPSSSCWEKRWLGPNSSCLLYLFLYLRMFIYYLKKKKLKILGGEYHPLRYLLSNWLLASQYVLKYYLHNWALKFVFCEFSKIMYHTEYLVSLLYHETSLYFNIELEASCKVIRCRNEGRLFVEVYSG